MGDEQISYLLSLPYEVLTYEILPKLSGSMVLKLCNINSRFNDACNDDPFWKIKIELEYHDIYDILKAHKNISVSWKEYYKYLLLSNKLRVYYNGDILMYIYINFNSIINFKEDFIPEEEPQFIPFIVAQLKLYLDQFTMPINISLINTETMEPIINIKYNNNNIQNINIKSDNYNAINKIILFVNDKFDVPPVIEQTSKRGRKPRSPRLVKSKNILKPDDKSFIYDQLISELSQIPIYGYFSDNNDFYIIDRNIESSDRRFIRNPKNINTYFSASLDALADNLGIYNDHIKGSYKKSDLINLIIKKLTEIGHIINI